MIDTRWSLKQKFEYRGQSIAYDVLGQGAPLVLVHGTPFSSYVWRTIARELGRGYKVYLYDLLGYGQSEKRRGQDVSLGVQNDVFAALIDHWKLTEPNVIAHDFGAATALRAHLVNGCDYGKLLLFDAVAVRPWGSPLVQHVRRHEEVFAGVPEYLQRAIRCRKMLPKRSSPPRSHFSPRTRRDRFGSPWRGPRIPPPRRGGPA